MPDAAPPMPFTGVPCGNRTEISVYHKAAENAKNIDVFFNGQLTVAFVANKHIECLMLQGRVTICYDDACSPDNLYP